MEQPSQKPVPEKEKKEDPQTPEALASLMEVEVQSRAQFPVFMKIIVVFLLFSVLPFLIITFTIALSYDASFRGIMENAVLAPEIRAHLMNQFASATHDLRIRIGFLFILFGTFVILGTRLAGKFLVNPFTSFLNAMERMGRGEYDTRITRNTSDEFAIFADYFNRMAQQLELAKHREQWLSQQKTQLISIAAHQLRTPLTVIQWVIGKLHDDISAFTKEQQDFLEKGIISLKRMTNLIDSLLSATAIEEGRFGYQFQAANLMAAVKKVIDGARLLAETKKIAVTIHAPQTLPPAYIDPEKIQIAFENILTNAVRYTPSGGKITIMFSVINDEKKGGREILVAIQDSGIGIAKKDAAKLFTRFFRSQEATSLYLEGAGLGLFITRNIILRHGGKIWTESEPGKGSTFLFTIPSAQGYHVNEASGQFITGAS